MSDRPLGALHASIQEPGSAEVIPITKDAIRDYSRSLVEFTYKYGGYKYAQLHEWLDTLNTLAQAKRSHQGGITPRGEQVLYGLGVRVGIALEYQRTGAIPSVNLVNQSVDQAYGITRTPLPERQFMGMNVFQKTSGQQEVKVQGDPIVLEHEVLRSVIEGLEDGYHNVAQSETLPPEVKEEVTEIVRKIFHNRTRTPTAILKSRIFESDPKRIGVADNDIDLVAVESAARSMGY